MDETPGRLCPECKKGHLEGGALFGEMSTRNAVRFAKSPWKRGTAVHCLACRECGLVTLRLETN